MKLLWGILLSAVLVSGCSSQNLSGTDAKTEETAATSQPTANDQIDPQNASYLKYSLDEAEGWKLKMTGQGMFKADNVMYKTNDGGKSWSEISNSSTGKLPGETISDLLFTSDERGWLTVNSPRGGYIGLFQTEDGGKTWSHTNVEGAADSTYTVRVPVFFSSTTYGILRVQNNESMKDTSLFFVTKDSGGTWEAISNKPAGQWNSLKWTITEDKDKTLWRVQVNDKTWNYNGSQWTAKPE